MVSVHDAISIRVHYDPQACSPSDWRKNFTPGLSTGGSLHPVAEYDYGADWAIAPRGLSPPGRTMLWAAPNRTGGFTSYGFPKTLPRQQHRATPSELSGGVVRV